MRAVVEVKSPWGAQIAAFDAIIAAYYDDEPACLRAAMKWLRQCATKYEACDLVALYTDILSHTAHTLKWRKIMNDAHTVSDLQFLIRHDLLYTGGDFVRAFAKLPVAEFGSCAEAIRYWTSDGSELWGVQFSSAQLEAIAGL